MAVRGLLASLLRHDDVGQALVVRVEEVRVGAILVFPSFFEDQHIHGAIGAVFARPREDLLVGRVVVQSVDGRQFFVELHERDVRRPLVRLVEDVGRVDHGGAAQLALLREVLEEPSSREDVEVGRELVDDLRARVAAMAC